MRWRQSWLFSRVRQFRLRDCLVRVKVEKSPNPRSSGNKVWLVGVWYDDYLSGMPLELVDRDQKSWQLGEGSNFSLGSILKADQPACLRLYTKDENLRLDFLAGSDCGRVDIQTPMNHQVIDLYTLEPGILSVYPHHPTMSVILERAGEPVSLTETTPAAPVLLAGTGKYTPQDLDWLSRQQADPHPLSINNPEWRGILASARQLFKNIYTIPDILDSKQAAYYARLFRDSACPSITIQGFPISYVHLIKALRVIAPDLPIYAIYHGNYLHTREDYDWRSFQTLKSLHDRGDIRRLGFVKQGMAEVMAAAGMRTAFVMNLVREIPTAPSQTLPGGWHIGIWGLPDSTWKKPPYAMLAAMKLIPDSRAHVYNVSQRAKDYGDLLKVPADYWMESLPLDQIAGELANMHVNMYITLTECAPMLPLESLSVGAPCLLGPTSHYFKDEPYLFSRLVVPEPDNAQLIAQYVGRVVEEREQVILAYQRYAPGYNQRALQALANFLQDG